MSPLRAAIAQAMSAEDYSVDTRRRHDPLPSSRYRLLAAAAAAAVERWAVTTTEGRSWVGQLMAEGTAHVSRERDLERAREIAAAVRKAAVS